MKISHLVTKSKKEREEREEEGGVRVCVWGGGEIKRGKKGAGGKKRKGGKKRTRRGKKEWGK